MIKLQPARDRSSYIVEVRFLDELKQPVTPLTIKWSLYDGKNRIVNTKVDQNVIPTYQTIFIPLRGDDVSAVLPSVNNTRKLVVEATYASELTGTQETSRQAATWDINSLEDTE